MNLLALVKQDLRLQFRHGFHLVYLVVTVLYVALGLLLPTDLRNILVPVLVFTDPGILAMLFIGAILLLERSDGTLQALSVTPVRPIHYLLSKFITLTGLALLTALVVSLAVMRSFNLMVLVVGVVLCSAFFLGVGVAVASRVHSVNGYFVTAGLIFAAFSIPLLGVFGLYWAPWFIILPSEAALQLIIGSYFGISWGAALIAVLVLVVWSGFSWTWALRWFKQDAIEGGGD